MIYVICLTQLLTVATMLVVARWGIKYLERQGELQGHSVDEVMKFAHNLIKEHNEEVKRILDQSFREREYMLTRIQHPEQAVTQAPGVDIPTGISFMDDRAEWERDYPDLVDEGESGVVRPLQPVPAFGAES